jgi:hypothetical protein
MPELVHNLPDFYTPSGSGPGSTALPTTPAPRNLAPGYFTWQQTGVNRGVTPVENQLQCGSCVAFAVTAMLESMVLIEHHTAVDLSEADLFEGGGSCKDGWMVDTALTRVMTSGVPLARCLAYPAGANETTVISGAPCPARPMLAITATSSYALYDPEARKAYLSTYGPMAACMDVYDDFMHYPGGPPYRYDGTSNFLGRHCVLVVGYDDLQQCWLVKNSWGANWGSGGFAWIGYGQCGIDSYTNFLGLNFGSPFWGLTGTQLPANYRLQVLPDRFRGTSLDDLAVYDPAMDLLYLGTNNGGAFSWNAGAMITGEPSLKPPLIFSGSFTGSYDARLLVHDPVTSNWSLGQFSGANAISWTTVGNTSGFGNVADGRPFWKGYFSKLNQEQVLFYSPGDHNWWLGTIAANQLTWQNVGNTASMGQVFDGRPILMDDFDGTARHDLLIYSPADQTWRLGSLDSGSWNWRVVATTPTFGSLAGAQLFAGYFRGVFQADLLLYTPTNWTWHLGSIVGGKLQFTIVGTTIQFANFNEGRMFGGRFTVPSAGVLHMAPNNLWRLGTVNSAGLLTWVNLGFSSGGFGLLEPSMSAPIRGTFEQSWQDELVLNDEDTGAWWLGTIGSGTISWRIIGTQLFSRS